MGGGEGVGANHKENRSQMNVVLQGKFPPYVEALYLQVVFPAGVDSWQGLPHVERKWRIKEHVSHSANT